MRRAMTARSEGGIVKTLPIGWATSDTTSRRKGRSDMTQTRGPPAAGLPSNNLKIWGLVSQKLVAAILVAFALFASPAFAQTDTAPPPHTADKANALTPEQARRALETLQDD